MRKITGSWLAATILGLLSATVAAENKFSYPNADGLTFYQGDSITVEYVTDYASPKLHIFCYNDEGEGVLGTSLHALWGKASSERRSARFRLEFGRS